MTPPPARPAPPAVDLDAVRARLNEHRLVFTESPIFYQNGHDAQDLEDIAALVVEVERLRSEVGELQADKDILTGNVKTFNSIDELIQDLESDDDQSKP